jgi:6-phosphogluconolactonase
MRMIAALMLSFAVAAAAAPQYLVYVGTYSGPKSQGIYAYRFDAASGKLDPLGLAAETPNPSFLAIHPNRRYLYAVNELSNFHGEHSGGVTSFAIDAKTGKLTQINQVSSRGSGPCHLSVDPTGKTVLVANYNAGSIVAYPIQSDGSLGEPSSFVQHHGSSVNKGRQLGPHAHFITTSADNRHAVVCDLGLDEILVYRFESGKLTDPQAAKVTPGAGPRHFAFSPSGSFGYAVTEMKPAVIAYAWNASTGGLKEIESLPTLPKDHPATKRDSGAEILVHPSGKFVYASTRGHDSIAVFAADAAKGGLTPVEIDPTGGKEPRSFGIDPEGKWLLAANQNSDTIVVFRIDPATGRLTPAGESVPVGSPVSIQFLPLE